MKRNTWMGLTSLGLSVLVAASTFGCGQSEDAAGLRGGEFAGPTDFAGSMSSSGQGSIAAGTLTAGVWDDNRNFDFFTDFLAENANADSLEFTAEEHAAANEGHIVVEGAAATLDISLVVDATGSMGDEMEYIKEEFRAISQTIQARYPDSEQRWSLVVYRDEGDEYVTRVFDFTGDLDEFRSNLQAQAASGGGDYPEASHAALREMNQLTWRTDESTARLAFWVADAPHHTQFNGVMETAVRDAQSAGVAIYPVASSGVDTMTEASMRAAAQLTGGRYIFLTDDSGVGGSHLEPSIPCYFVTKLDDAILRMVDVEMSGTYREPTAEEVIRSAGDPSEGICRLEMDEYKVF